MTSTLTSPAFWKRSVSGMLSLALSGWARPHEHEVQAAGLELNGTAGWDVEEG